ncbi:hypothetical protein BDN72DRAFT_870881 [Pluteus cervinus]|uniref:Uncharacterized protein n=1 Tax=Pluteus cervinus TaxID=181527 RepID=A0ACD3AT44_9AGAR|nr:hypothetical protein BDN72DRAFT_870881 [Pluteus cervinus]
MATSRGPTPTPWSYFFIRLLFKFVLKIFYGTIVIENAELIPKNGRPCIVCPNHSNSLTDALMLVTSVSSSKRNLLRLTAKSTLFGRRNFTSWLIESAGTIPMMRKKDFTDGEKVDNSQTMTKLMEALELGDAVCLFPEGISRYHPTLAPLKTGVARLVSDVLTRNRDTPDFEISIVTCSITYMHREHFRSDVLVTFHPPMMFRPSTHPELLDPVQYEEVRNITARMHEQISHGTLDSPTWELLRIGKLAARMYAPLGTHMSLGDFVRISRTFIESFKDVTVDERTEGPEGTYAQDPTTYRANQLMGDLKVYQDKLAALGIKDDRIRKPLSRRTILVRMLIRLVWSLFLFSICAPGLCLWLPVFGTTRYAAHHYTKTGPVHDTWDEIAQYKLTYGLFSGLLVWFAVVALTLPFSVITTPLVPIIMWMTLRWFEDAVSAFRAFVALLRLLRTGKVTLKNLYEERRDLHSRLVEHAVGTLGLPADPEGYFAGVEGAHKGQVKGGWDSGARYFSVRRRRKRDWNETLRLYDKVDYPNIDS